MMGREAHLVLVQFAPKSSKALWDIEQHTNLQEKNQPLQLLFEVFHKQYKPTVRLKRGCCCLP